MNVHINLVGVLVAGVASMVVGFLYYSPALFGENWMKLAKLNPRVFRKEQPRVMPIVFLCALLTAYVIGYFMYLYQIFFRVSWMNAGFVTAFILWFGISMTSVYVHNALEQRPFNLTLISLGNRLLSFIAMGLVLGWLHP